MSGANTSGNGPDFTQGIVTADLADGAMLLGRVGDAPALLVRRGADLLVIGATCTHYGGPLAEGLMVDDTVRCPWHHACFSLRTGEALRPPALNGLPCWRVEQRDGMVFVRETARRRGAHPRRPRHAELDRHRRRRRGRQRGGRDAAARRLSAARSPCSSADADAPYDRPNLSKDFLAGTAAEDWIPLRSAGVLPGSGSSSGSARASPRSTGAPRGRAGDGSRVAYDALLLATGAEPCACASGRATAARALSAHARRQPR